MSKRVLSVGQCSPDHNSIRQLIETRYSATVVPADRAQDALEKLHSERYDLVLVNRKLDIDYSDGLEVIKQIKADPELREVPVMLITNYAEHQQLAVEAGAVPGFGKLEYEQPQTHEKLQKYLG